MTSESTEKHREEARGLAPARVAVLTISDTRTLADDKSGALIETLLREAGQTVALREVLKDEPEILRERVRALASSGEIDAILTTGGTGITARDGTFEAVSGLLDKTLPGFGELFRMLSWDEVGAAAMLSRAVAGLHGRTLIFCMPGSSNAVGVAMRRLIVPELAHLVYEVNRQGP